MKTVGKTRFRAALKVMTATAANDNDYDGADALGYLAAVFLPSIATKTGD